jgi:hypothetical protein
MEETMPVVAMNLGAGRLREGPQAIFAEIPEFSRASFATEGHWVSQPVAACIGTWLCSAQKPAVRRIAGPIAGNPATRIGVS